MNKIVFSVLLTIAALASTINQAYASDELSAKAQLEQQLELHQGKVIYLDFWASWCGPCRKSFPWMNNMQTNFQDQGFVIISVNLDAEQDLAETFLQENPASFAVIYDPKGQTAREYRVKGMPTSYVIGRDGKVKVAHTGFFTKKIPSYEAEIKKLLAEKAP